MEVLPFYPDFVNWKYPCAQVIFDSDPAPVNSNKNMPAQIEEMSQAMIRYDKQSLLASLAAYVFSNAQLMQHTLFLHIFSIKGCHG